LNSHPSTNQRSLTLSMADVLDGLVGCTPYLREATSKTGSTLVQRANCTGTDSLSRARIANSLSAGDVE